MKPGELFSNGGIEADEVTADSPRNVQVLAEIKNLFGDGHNAQMTYYATHSGAKVFAAGRSRSPARSGSRPYGG